MIREAVTSSPLYWPPGWKRTPQPERSRFGATSVHRQTQEVLAELARMGVGDWNVILSTNIELRRDGLPYSSQRRIDDAGAAVWFTYEDEERVLACDRWLYVACNLRAIAKHIGAMRGQERWGVGSLEQSFRGYTALPAGDERRSWWDVLEVRPDASQGVVEANYKRRALDCHPDRGGSPEAWHELAEAYSEALEAVQG